MATSNAAYAQYALKKDAMDEQRELEKAGKKKGLWGSLGTAARGLGAMALLGPAGLLAGATPLVAGLVSGGMSAAGGLAGKELLTSKKNKDLLKKEGGMFHKGGREDMNQAITTDILKGAATSALTAGVAAGAAPKAPTEAGIAGMGAEQAALPEGLRAKAPNLVSAPEITPLPNLKTPTAMSNDSIFDMSFGNVSQSLGDF